MREDSMIVIGGPDSGKSNYIGRLWLSLDKGVHSLVAVEQPSNIDYVLGIAEHLCRGEFAPRTEHSDERRDFEMVVGSRDGSERARIIVPDISGELWRNAVETAELESSWVNELENAAGALLFVRVGSPANVSALNWVTSAGLLAKIGKTKSKGTPTQVMLCELIRFLEHSLGRRTDGSSPRIAVIVSAWDGVDPETFDKGPEEFVEKNWPMLAGRLEDTPLKAKVFGLSVVGGDLLTDNEYKQKVREGDITEAGWVAVKDEGGKWSRDPDLTLPVAWVLDL